MANPLGNCEKCHGALCVRGQTIACSRCGHPHPEHPRQQEWANQPAPAPTRPIAVLPQDYPASVPDRVNKLERDLQAALSRIAQLEQAQSSRAHKRPA